MTAPFPGARTRSVVVGPMVLEVVLDAGPRILGCRRPDGPSPFARLPGEVIEHPTVGTFAFIGGHRLWRAPEVPATTYRPDARPVRLEELDGGLVVTGHPDADGLVPALEVRAAGEHLVVDHVLHHTGTTPVRCAPWAITQLAVGGTAVVPLADEPVDVDAVQPNRALVLWPYTDPADPELDLRRDEVRVHSSSDSAKAKVGTANRRGWLAYAVDGELFVKWATPHDDGADHVDFGATAQCYRDDRFLELETLGPLVTLRPGATVRHRETWWLTPLADRRLDDVLADLPTIPGSPP